MTSRNEFTQPIGAPLGAWTPPPPPPSTRIEGRTVTLEPLEPDLHAGPLYAVFEEAPDSLWTYMAFGPFDGPADFAAALRSMTEESGWVPYAIVADDGPLGFASYLRIAPAEGVIEIGAISLSPRLQRTTAATEAIYLMIRNVFDLGYRRCEWKCDDLNEPSRAAALRLGFSYEGTFRQATHYKGRNRDTAWYAIVDGEWQALDSVFQRWLSPDNFDEDGRQRRTLGQMRERND